jgi:hypothetical protein
MKCGSVFAVCLQLLSSQAMAFSALDIQSENPGAPPRVRVLACATRVFLVGEGRASTELILYGELSSLGNREAISSARASVEMEALSIAYTALNDEIAAVLCPPFCRNKVVSFQGDRVSSSVSLEEVNEANRATVTAEASAHAQVRCTARLRSVTPGG